MKKKKRFPIQGILLKVDGDKELRQYEQGYAIKKKGKIRTPFFLERSFAEKIFKKKRIRY